MPNPSAGKKSAFQAWFGRLSCAGNVSLISSIQNQEKVHLFSFYCTL